MDMDPSTLLGSVWGIIFKHVVSKPGKFQDQPESLLQEACFNSEEAKNEMAAISGRDPSEFKAGSFELSSGDAFVGICVVLMEKPLENGGFMVA